MTAPSAKPRKVRADSERNRTRLIEAARLLLAQGHDNVSLEAVAREAGVGIGTLYRHFPSRQALFETLYLDNLEAICILAAELSETLPPAEALRVWLGTFIDSVASNRGMRAALSIAFNPEEQLYVESIEMLTAAADILLGSAAAGGMLNREFRGRTLVQVLIALCGMKAVESWQETSREVCDIFVAGLVRSGS